MKRLVMKVIINMCAKTLALTTIVGVLIGVVGYLNKWDSPLKYSNAFFLAGCLVLIAGMSSRLSAGQNWHSFQLLSAASFRGMSSSDRVNFIFNTSSSISALVLGLLSGILLILISAVVAYLF